MPKTQTFFIGAKHGKSAKTGNPYGLVEVAVIENGKGRSVTMFCDPEVAQMAESITPLAAVLCDFEQRMTGSGPRSDLVSIAPA